MIMLLLTILLLGPISANPKYALIETEDAPDEPNEVDAGLDKLGEPTGNNIEPAKGADYCAFGPCPPWSLG